jgi:hypothetical protein
MGGSKTSNYLTGGLQSIAGAAATAFGAPEIGIPLMTGGVGQLAGTGLGGTKGGTIGEMAGLGAGTLGEGFAGMGPLSGMLGAGKFGGPGAEQLQQLGSGLLKPSQVSAGQLAGPEDVNLIRQGASALSAAEQPGGALASAGGGGLMDFLKSPGGAALAQGGLSAMTPGASTPPPAPPGVPARPAPPTLPPTPPMKPAVATVPKPGAGAAPGAGGGSDILQQLALLRMMGGTTA